MFGHGFLGVVGFFFLYSKNIVTTFEVLREKINPQYNSYYVSTYAFSFPITDMAVFT